MESGRHRREQGLAFFDCLDNIQDLGSEGRPAGCWETPCLRDFKFAHLELFHVLNLISLHRKREKFLWLSFDYFSRDSLNLTDLVNQWVSLSGDREVKENGERDTENHGQALTALLSLDLPLSCWCEVFPLSQKMETAAVCCDPETMPSTHHQAGGTQCWSQSHRTLQSCPLLWRWVSASCSSLWRS